ncbi:transporter [Paraburkholderia flagellata]|uniref:transporter n=1 Tax=Paraburkholderia flagellata TaxID=2883241 RepID=UPI003570BBF8
MTVSGGRSVFVPRFEFYVFAPAGAYDPNRTANPRSGFWSLNPYWSMNVMPTAVDRTARWRVCRTRA